MALSRVISKKLNVEKYRDLEIQVKGQSGSLKVPSCSLTNTITTIREASHMWPWHEYRNTRSTTNSTHNDWSICHNLVTWNNTKTPIITASFQINHGRIIKLTKLSNHSGFCRSKRWWWLQLELFNILCTRICAHQLQIRVSAYGNDDDGDNGSRDVQSSSQVITTNIPTLS